MITTNYCRDYNYKETSSWTVTTKGMQEVVYCHRKLCFYHQLMEMVTWDLILFLGQIPKQSHFLHALLHSAIYANTDWQQCWNVFTLYLAKTSSNKRAGPEDFKQEETSSQDNRAHFHTLLLWRTTDSDNRFAHWTSKQPNHLGFLAFICDYIRLI